MSDETGRQEHGADNHDHGDGKAPDDGLLFPFLVVLVVAVGLGWLTQPGPGSTTAAPQAAAETPAAEPATGEPASAVAMQPPIYAPPIKPSPKAAPQQPAAAEPYPRAAPPAAPEQSAAPEPPARPQKPAVPEAAATPAPAGAAGGGAFDRIAALTALGRNAQAASHCRSAGASPGTARVVVAFSPDGHVSTARIISPKYVGTPTGSCILGHIRQTTIPPFAGGKPATVVTGVHLF